VNQKSTLKLVDLVLIHFRFS